MLAGLIHEPARILTKRAAFKRLALLCVGDCVLNDCHLDETKCDTVGDLHDLICKR